ncbi:LysR substrate-binding domain-containing protein [Ancylobacter mangrovi]|uniref:LysR substrate-binding domain-containing protein n=1 Tax=Ancylobacter mangrovi TaxID=2972472 RepID=UPI002162686A|nr:LysR substrate-binding domain-containing protein [Ancylobacter mangrovi]MCS0504176.1 LysR substrate-binding domain-containing protein [Ancylobacter mangrovi]
MAYRGGPDLSDLQAFAAIVRHLSFTRAAIELGVSTSALSHRIRRLEAGLEVRLLNRTSRSVVPTQAGAALAERLARGFEAIGDALGALDLHRRYPVGRLRLNVPHDAARLLLAPVIGEFVERYPQIHLDVIADDRPVDIVAAGFDAGIRYADHVPGDMIAMQVTPPLDWVVVGAPALLDRLGRPRTPDDLADYPCIQMRIGDSTSFPWELGEGERLRRLDVSGPLSSNDTDYSIAAAIEGAGLAYCLAWRVAAELAEGTLEVVLPDWASPGAPFAVYYPSRRQPPPGLRQLVELLKRRSRLG